MTAPNVRTYPPGAATQAKPDVSVLFLAYQQEAYVTEAVRSILAQDQVVAEIILSDDASTDRTFARMAAAAKGYSGPHHLVVRRNQKNMGIDHIVQLVELASSDVMVMAHADDVSEPNRCRRLLDELEQTGAFVASSNYLEIDERGRPMGLNLAEIKSREHTASDIASAGWQRTMFGATLAWRREVYTRFPRLDANYLPIGHDTLVPFRGAVLGGMRYVAEPLVRYRRHAGQWHRLFYDGNSRETWQESRDSLAIMARLAMARDLQHLLDREKPAGARRQQLEHLQGVLNASIQGLVADWVAARQALYRQGWRATWVSRDEFSRNGRLLGLGLLRSSRNAYRRLRWQLFNR